MKVLGKAYSLENYDFLVYENSGFREYPDLKTDEIIYEIVTVSGVYRVSKEMFEKVKKLKQK